MDYEPVPKKKEAGCAQVVVDEEGEELAKEDPSATTGMRISAALWGMEQMEWNSDVVGKTGLLPTEEGAPVESNKKN